MKVIGYAGMTENGTILMRVRSCGTAQSNRNLAFYAPGDDKYAEIFAHLGGISPGQTEPVSPFRK
jgi:hypothetical protein